MLFLSGCALVLLVPVLSSELIILRNEVVQAGIAFFVGSLVSTLTAFFATYITCYRQHAIYNQAAHLSKMQIWYMSASLWGVERYSQEDVQQLAARVDQEILRNSVVHMVAIAAAFFLAYVLFCLGCLRLLAN